MKIKIKTSEQCAAHTWSGGETTELFIYPPDASLQARNFIFRISTATVQKSGNFSIFANYQRILMLLSETGLRLHLKDQTIMLDNKYQQFCFSGDAELSAQLTSDPIRDFNVIFKTGTLAKVDTLTLRNSATVYDTPETRSCNFLLMYADSGSTSIRVDNESYNLEAGSMLILEKDTPYIHNLKMQAHHDCAVVLIVTLANGKD